MLVTYMRTNSLETWITGPLVARNCYYYNYYYGQVSFL